MPIVTAHVPDKDARVTIPISAMKSITATQDPYNGREMVITLDISNVEAENLCGLIEQLTGLSLLPPKLLPEK